jgi:hypothetical protein
MVFPLIPLVLIATGSLTGGTGLLAGAHGALKLRHARQDVAAATTAYEQERSRTLEAAKATNELIRAYGLEQEAAVRDVVLRMSDFIRRNQRQVSASMKLLVDGVDVEVNSLAEPDQIGRAAYEFVRGIVASGATGLGAAAGTTSLVTSFGAASTGMSISALSGAAAESATLAALGGGSLAAGGGGMALGATALNFVTVGPALLVGGLMVNSQGEKALTQAKAFVTQARIAQKDVAAMRTHFGAVEQRVDELSGLLANLMDRATDAIGTLEAIEGLDEAGFQADLHAGEFQEAMGLTIAVRDVAGTPVVEEDGKLNRQTAKMKIKYKEFVDDPQ